MKKIKSLSLILAVIMVFSVFLVFPQQAEAATVKTNVVTQIKNKSYSGTGYQIVKFTYNKKGLLTKQCRYEHNALQETITYKYNSDNLVKSLTVTDGSGTTRTTAAYTYTNKKLTKRVTKDTTMDSTATTKYTWKGNVLSKAVTTIKGGWEDGEKITETFTFKNGILNKKVTKTSVANWTNTYTYDKYGFLRRDEFSGEIITRRLTYKNGVLTKYQDTATYDGGSDKDLVRTVSSKQLSVTKALSAIVKEQQREIINGTHGTNLYLGYYS